MKRKSRMLALVGAIALTSRCANRPYLAGEDAGALVGAGVEALAGVAID